MGQVLDDSAFMRYLQIPTHRDPVEVGTGGRGDDKSLF